MTRPVHPPHRIGFAIAGPLTRFVQQDAADLRGCARFLYLETLACVTPDVLNELAAIQTSHDPALRDWLQRWWLVSSDPADDWCMAHARGTRRAWLNDPTPRVWHDRDDVSGEIVSGRRRKQADRWLLSPAHLVWLARVQTGESYSNIARTPAADLCAAFPPRRATPSETVESWSWPPTGATVSTVHAAVARLATAIRLQRRPTKRGRAARTTPNTRARR